MRQKLEKLTSSTLKSVASDISIVYTDQKTTANEVANYYRAYGLRWEDLVARYAFSFPEFQAIK